MTNKERNDLVNNAFELLGVMRAAAGQGRVGKDINAFKRYQCEANGIVNVLDILGERDLSEVFSALKYGELDIAASELELMASED